MLKSSFFDIFPKRFSFACVYVYHKLFLNRYRKGFLSLSLSHPLLLLLFCFMWCLFFKLKKKSFISLFFSGNYYFKKIINFNL